MNDRLAVFLDDGGVLSDNAVKARHWQKLVGEFLAPRLGGSREAWARANRAALEEGMRRYEAVLRGRPDADFSAWWEPELGRWLQDMCHVVGVPPPEGDEGRRLAEETSRYVTMRAPSAALGSVDAVRDLHSRGYALHTASGSPSMELHGYLHAMDIRELFGERLYGPDLINRPKEGAEFYRRIFADAGVDPARAVVVDDSSRAAEWASEAGATAVVVSADGSPAPDGRHTVRSLADLPPLLDAMRS